MKWRKITSQLYATSDSSSTESTFLREEQPNILTTCLHQNIQTLQKIFNHNPYLIMNRHRLLDREIVLVHFLGLSDRTEIREYILHLSMPNMSNTSQSSTSLFQLLKQLIDPIAGGTSSSCIKEIVNTILSGNTVFLLENHDQSYIVSTGASIERSISEPPSQNVLRGPRDGFTESLQTNTILIFQRIKNPSLCIKQKTIGTITNTNIGIVYIQDIVNEGILNKLMHRINNIKLEGILESAYIEPYLLDDGYSPFPTIYHTERPDIVAAALLKGRIAIIVDKTPFVLIVPSLFQHFLQSNEDEYQSVYFSSFLRILRYSSFWASILLPSLFIAITCFHQEIIPTPLLMNLAAQRSGVPFPPIIEMLLMEITFEVFREAALRLPRTVANSISIVGALVIGEAAVQAGIVSSATIIIVACTAITNFTFPLYTLSLSTRLIRFGFLLCASIFGLYGVILGIIILLLHLCGVSSFGLEYFSPSSTQKKEFFRTPYSAQNRASLLEKCRSYFKNRRRI
ncbi:MULTISPECIES: spore germination protein [Bacillus cereus group]|uniref:spore germination protein n=1 Tax=Bacillus cereus group TaxID=86661 RepID=UPI000CD815B6|nr:MULTISPECIES: spore germination protein [Bacillus cereus group]MBG9826528.1 spore gernimation protein KB [Bacillus wiedmannii]MED3080090.1 spore germination protein [Bacillus wiedmannii]UOB98472.1 putative membrane protein YndD [Bacillus wiedmannii]